jgi:putative flippase GtrA
MRRRLRLFLVVGLLVTVVDVLVLLGLASLGMPLVIADVVSVAVAAVVSFVLHRSVTFAGEVDGLVEHRPRPFARAVAPALVVDVAVLAVGVLVFGPDSAGEVLAVKAVAVAAAAVVRLLAYRRILFAAVRADQARRPDRAPLTGGPRLSIVLPAFEAADFVGDTLARIRQALAALADDGGVELVVVDDGSPDGTAEAARAGGADQVVRLPANRGKGAAVRAGMLQATGRTIAFTDVDLAYPPDQLVRFCEAVEEGWDVVVGNRRHPDSVVPRGSAVRELGSAIFNLFSQLVLLGDYRDTQCGLKVFRRDVAQSIFARTRIDRFAFDVEVLHLVEHDRLRLREEPVVLDPTEVTTVRFARAALGMLRDVIRIRRLSARGEYDLPIPSRSA